MASKTAADVLVETLIAWNVEVIFGLPGDGINGIMEALRQAQDRIRFIQVRHEEAAAFMACGYAKYTGRLGVCLATSGPGGIHLLNGLYDAKLDGQPVLAITGHHFHDVINTHAQQDVNLDRLFMDVSVYNVRIMGPRHVCAATHLACRTALARRGVAHINFPVDLQSEPLSADTASERNVPGHARTEIMPHRAGIPSPTDLRAAARVLNEGHRVVILAGAGALHAGDELEAIAEKLGAPIVKALLGKACVPDDSPYTTGGIGLLGTRPSQEALEHCDTLLLVGTSFPYIEFFPKPGQARAVQIDRDPVRLGLRYPVEVGLVGDARAALQLLNSLLLPKPNRSFLRHAQRGMKQWRELMEERGTRGDKPMKPQVVAWELGRRLAPDAIVSCDSGTITTWFARQIPARRGQMFSLSGTLATMGCGLPYANAAQIAHPDRQCVAFVGDGGLTMLMGELATAVKYRLPVKVFVLKNNTLGQIKWEQMVFLGNPEYGCDLEPIDFTGIARACGLPGLRIEDPAECGHVVEQALATPGPVLVEAVIGPNEPPMPGKIKAKQALHFAESLARGTPNRMKIISTVAEDRVRELV
ncbi:MAG TPA: thiamine pyrophosphate-dependent enzyme [Lacunisphaera sp.]|jgi:pyruvate dehydrogenase (quinone)/pyruvate oxidase|nr:thiamine pyrophosphate-dependent enzyme [Lacunisphaera sp.]